MALHTLQRFGIGLIVLCRFIPGGRTAVTVTCGIVGYDRKRFVLATACAGAIWGSYAYLLGRLGGAAFEGRPWAGLLLALATALVLSGLGEGVRRIRGRRHRSHQSVDLHTATTSTSPSPHRERVN